jgi:hypothetical protein
LIFAITFRHIVIMRTSPPITDFHKWLAAGSEGQSAPCSILIHGEETPAKAILIQQIAEYLNEYDDESDGRWLAATDDLVCRISGDAFLRQLVGLDFDIASGRTAFAKTFSALASRGHVIAQSPPTLECDFGIAHTFDVGLGELPLPSCHMVLNPEKIAPAHLAPIIGDVFLEWFHHDARRGSESYNMPINSCAANERIRREA